MKPVSDALLDKTETLAMKSVDVMSQFLTYQGDNPQYYHKAKIAAAGAMMHVRLRATETNRMAVELAAQRQIGAPERHE